MESDYDDEEGFESDYLDGQVQESSSNEGFSKKLERKTKEAMWAPSQ